MPVDAPSLLALNALTPAPAPAPASATIPESHAETKRRPDVFVAAELRPPGSSSNVYGERATDIGLRQRVVAMRSTSGRRRAVRSAFVCFAHSLTTAVCADTSVHLFFPCEIGEGKVDWFCGLCDAPYDASLDGVNCDQGALFCCFVFYLILCAAHLYSRNELKMWQVLARAFHADYVVSTRDVFILCALYVFCAHVLLSLRAVNGKTKGVFEDTAKLSLSLSGLAYNVVETFITRMRACLIACADLCVLFVFSVATAEVRVWFAGRRWSVAILWLEVL